MSGLDRFQDPMTPTECAKRWRVSDETVRALCRDGRIPGSFQVGSQWRIPKSAVIAYELAMEEEAKVGA